MVCATLKDNFFVPAFNVKTADNNAARDAFNERGGLLVHSQFFAYAKEILSAAGALTAIKFGAQTSIPDREILDTFLKERYKGIISCIHQS